MAMISMCPLFCGLGGCIGAAKGVALTRLLTRILSEQEQPSMDVRLCILMRMMSQFLIPEKVICLYIRMGGFQGF